MLLDTATFHTADMGSLVSMLDSSTLSEHRLFRIKRLNVTSRVSLFSFRMETVDSQDLERPQSPVLDETQWRAACRALSRLNKLVELHLHLDHDDPLSYWTCIDERRLLSCIPRLPNASVTVSLPLLHPGAERPDCHFMPDSPAPDGFTIQRRLRQTYYVEDPTRLTGSFSIAKASDFPLLRHSPPYIDQSLQQVIDHEREMWKHATANGHVVTLERQTSLVLEEQFGQV